LLLCQRNVIVLTDTLKYEERRCRTFTVIGNEVRAHWTDSIDIARVEPHLFFWLTQEKPNAPFENVEGILNVRVTMPRYVLCRGDLQFRNPEPRTLYMINAAFDGVEMAGVFNRFHASTVAKPACVLERQMDDISISTAKSETHAVPLFQLQPRRAFQIEAAFPFVTTTFGKSRTSALTRKRQSSAVHRDVDA
jgi:hypothetical protein